MLFPESSNAEQVEHLLRNAQLRDELEPLFDESIGSVNVERMTLRHENEFLESMLEWERAPMLPIREWFTPPLDLAPPDALSDEQLSAELAAVAAKLFEERVVLDFTDHLSDRQLYALIFRDILPSFEKKLDRRENYLHWDCANAGGDPEVWLRYYATDEERDMWAEESGEEPPTIEDPPFHRRLPKAPL